MSWWGKVVGGAVGFAVGGPMGAAVGAGLGAMADMRRPKPEAGPPPLEVDATIRDDTVGALWKFTIAMDLRANVVGLVTFADGGGEVLHGRGAFVDADGAFVAITPVSDGTCRVYVPYGAVSYKSPADTTLRLLIASKEDARIIGVARFDADLPSPRAWRPVEYIQPLVEMGMAVAYADGRLAREEIALLRRFYTESFELRQRDMRALQTLMKHAKGADLKNVVKRVRFRFPNAPKGALLELLAAVAQCDGEVHANEVKVIRRVSRYLGIAPERWSRLSKRLRLDVTSDDLKSAKRAEQYVLLGLRPGATVDEVRRAYRDKLTQYHPDKVARMAPEFSELAHRKTKELNAAYAALMAELT